MPKPTDSNHEERDARRALLLWDGQGHPPADPHDRHQAVGSALLLALGRFDRLRPEDLMAGLNDADQRVRLCALRLAAAHPATHDDAIRTALLDLLAGDDHLVAEAAAAALGETGEDREAPADLHTVRALSKAATDHPDKLVREAAVAALGSLGHPDALAAVLVANDDVATVRRRAVLALAAFEGPEVERRLNAALSDRDWQVRQGAEDLLEAAPSPAPLPTDHPD